MYSLFNSGSKINLWCEGKPLSDKAPPPRKRPYTTKRELFEGVDDVFKKLKEKHSDMPLPKLRLWARLIHTGRHDDYEKPPDLPLITGSPTLIKPKKENLSDAITGAATAVVKLLKSNSHDKGHLIAVRKLMLIR